MTDLSFYPRIHCAPSCDQLRFHPVYNLYSPQNHICIYAGTPMMPPRVLASGPKSCGGNYIRHQRIFDCSVILMALSHLCPGLNAVTNLSNFTIFRFSFKFNKFCDYSFNSTRRYMKNPLPQRFFGTLCRNLQFYANRPTSAGLRILQKIQLHDFSISHCEICDFLHFFVMQIPPSSADLRILQNLRFFAVN